MKAEAHHLNQCLSLFASEVGVRSAAEAAATEHKAVEAMAVQRASDQTWRWGSEMMKRDARGVLGLLAEMLGTKVSH